MQTAAKRRLWLVIGAALVVFAVALLVMEV